MDLGGSGGPGGEFPPPLGWGDFTRTLDDDDDYDDDVDDDDDDADDDDDDDAADDDDDEEDDEGGTTCPRPAPTGPDRYEFKLAFDGVVGNLIRLNFRFADPDQLGCTGRGAHAVQTRSAHIVRD